MQTRAKMRQEKELVQKLRKIDDENKTEKVDGEAGGREGERGKEDNKYGSR